MKTCAFRPSLGAMLLLALIAYQAAGAGLTIHRPPPGEAVFEDCTVEVNGNPVFVYKATVNRSAPAWDIVPETVGFASFDFSGEVQVKITTAQPLRSAEVRPRSYAIPAAVEGRTVSFTLSRPRKLCVEFNGSDRRPLFLFANAMESDQGGVPQPGEANVRFFAPGVHRVGEIRPRSGETIYLAGGAVVYGKIVADGVRGVRILGRGILDGSQWKQWETNLLLIKNSSDIEIRGIILRDSPSWTMDLRSCERLTVADVKILCHRKNSDGIDLVDCRHGTVEDCFVRNYDDSIIVKAQEPGGRDVEDIMVRHCVVWCDWGFSLGMTYEARVATIRGLRFEDCDVLHGMACRGVLGVKNGDRATVRDVRFDNIRVEDARVQLLELVIDRDQFSQDAERGHIHGVLFRNISLNGGAFVPSTLAGYDAEHRVEDVTFKNLRIHGKVVTRAEEGKIRINPHVREVLFFR